MRATATGPTKIRPSCTVIGMFTRSPADEVMRAKRLNATRSRRRLGGADAALGKQARHGFVDAGNRRRERADRAQLGVQGKGAVGTQIERPPVRDQAAQLDRSAVVAPRRQGRLQRSLGERAEDGNVGADPRDRPPQWASRRHRQCRVLDDQGDVGGTRPGAPASVARPLDTHSPDAQGLGPAVLAHLDCGKVGVDALHSVTGS